MFGFARRKKTPNVSLHPAAVEPLESRRLLSASLSITGQYPNDGRFPGQMPAGDDLDKSNHSNNVVQNAADLAVINTEAALMNSLGAPDGARNLNHFAAGTGGSIIYANGSALSNDALKSPEFLSVEQHVFSQVRSAAALGKTAVKLTLGSGDLPYWNDVTRETNLFFADHGTQGILVSGKLAQKGNLLSGNIEFDIYDAYGFGASDASTKWGTPNFLTAARDYQTHGNGAEFTTIIKVIAPFTTPYNLTINLNATAPISSFAGVGFRTNPVAALEAHYPSGEITDPTQFTAKVHWGDGSGLTGADVASAKPSANSGFPFVILGSHTYKNVGVYQIVVQIIGPGGVTVTRQTCSCTVLQMPAIAARPGTVPPIQSHSKPETVVTINPLAWAPIQSFAGVGFHTNPVAVLSGSYNGVGDTNPADYHAEINWGDSTQWFAGDVVADPAHATGFPMVVLGSHTYQNVGVFPIVVNITGPDGQTIARQTCSTTVLQMPATASRPGSQPAVQPHPKAETYITVSPNAWAPIQSFAGVGFRLNTIAVLSGNYDGVGDINPSDYRAQVNWGDTTQWSNADVVADPAKATNFPMIVKGSHTYSKPGVFPIVVNITGPDGQTIARQTCSCTVLAMPSPGSQPITQPGVLSGDRPENYLTINPNAVAPLLTKVGVSTGIKPIGVLNGTYDGKPAPIPLDYHAQVNWGDSGQWFSADVVADVLNGFPLRILGSHTYTKAGVYSIVLNITGPDGQTIARATCSCTVLAH